MNNTFGIYVMTYPKDYRLSRALVNSLKFFSPQYPITIIPGAGFNYNDHPFDDCPIMKPPATGFWSQIDHADRKFWAFQGLYEKFLYLDADVICTHSIDALVNAIIREDAPFIYGNLMYVLNGVRYSFENESDIELIRRLQRISTGQLGNLDNIKLFDPAFNVSQRFTINSGVFASSRDTLHEEDFESLMRQEVAFYENVLKKNFSWKNCDLFLIDQGRLNYLISKKNIPIRTCYPFTLYEWGGYPYPWSLDEVLNNVTKNYFIHWAGGPHPSLSLLRNSQLLSSMSWTKSHRILEDVPGAFVWRYFNHDKSVRRAILDSASDIRSIFKSFRNALVHKLVK